MAKDANDVADCCMCQSATPALPCAWSRKRCCCCVVSPLHQASAATQSWARAAQMQAWFCFIHPLLANLSRVDPADKGTMRASLAVSLSHCSQPSQALCYDYGSESSTLRSGGMAALMFGLVWPSLRMSRQGLHPKKKTIQVSLRYQLHEAADGREGWEHQPHRHVTHLHQCMLVPQGLRVQGSK